jgi:hypothetical protein
MEFVANISWTMHRCMPCPPRVRPQYSLYTYTCSIAVVVFLFNHLHLHNPSCTCAGTICMYCLRLHARWVHPQSGTTGSSSLAKELHFHIASEKPLEMLITAIAVIIFGYTTTCCVVQWTPRADLCETSYKYLVSTEMWVPTSSLLSCGHHCRYSDSPILHPAYQPGPSTT